MSYRLIDANMLNNKISSEDYEVVLNAPCIYADLLNGLDNEHYVISKWIPISERLPEINGRYLVCTDKENIQIIRFAFGSWNSRYDSCVIAWMPLPEPYKAEIEVEE